MIFAQIKDGLVINTIVASKDDPFDPNYVFIDVTNIQCTDGSGVQINCPYDGKAFSPAPVLPNPLEIK